MNDFQYYTPTKVVFGRGTEEQAGQLVKECTRTCWQPRYYLGKGGF